MKLDVAFDLDFTLCCGQVFRWAKKGDWWFGVVNDHVVKIRQVGSELEFENVSEEFVRRYFGLNDDLEKIANSVGKDEYIKKALKRFEGLRIIRQDPWECLISFACATYKNIAAIKHMLNNIAEKHGEKVMLDDLEFYTFPTTAKLANASENGLRECGLGYRAKYIQALSRKIRDEKINLENLKSLPYLQAKKLLATFPGVGFKVADCVLLFSLEKMEAFPVDVWVKRVMLRRYCHCFPEALIKKLSRQESLSNSEYEKLNSFGREYFGEYAGYAQEYLYHYERTQK